MIRRERIRVLLGLTAIFAGLFLLKKNPYLIERFYVEDIYPQLSILNQSLWSWIPFSIGDIGYALSFTYTVKILFRFSFRRDIWKTLCTLGWVVTFFYIFWGLHYFKTPMRLERQLPHSFTLEKLVQTTNYYAEQTKKLHKKLSFSDTLRVETDMQVKEVLDLATLTMENTKLRPEKLHGKAKATLFPTLLSYMGFGGYANPFTHEAQVNTLQPKLRIITTACHEIAHQWGYAAEDEANYVGIKASSCTNNTLVAYAGNLLAFQYLQAALYREDKNRAQEITTTLPQGVLKNIREGIDFWKRYQNPFEVVFEKGYDQYLKANKQQEGIRSYSLVVGLLIDDFTLQEL